MAPSIPLFDHLPDSVLMEILVRVPALFLQRLRVVCRRWKTIINQKQFVDAQHKRSLSGYPSLVMFFEPDGLVCVSRDPGAVRTAAALVVGGEDTELELGGSSHERAIPKIPFSVWSQKEFEWVTSMPWNADQGSNLMCYRTDDYIEEVVLTLLNPVTGKRLKLPHCPYFCLDCYKKEFSHWFGMDLLSGFYKVVVVTPGCGCYGYSKPAGMIYTVGKDRSWRKLGTKARDRLLKLAGGLYSDHTYYRGRLFWPLTSPKMVVFDFASEMIQLVDTPEKGGDLFVMGNSTSRTLAYVSKVCDSTSSRDRKISTYRTWVINEGSRGDEPVWTLWDRGDMKIPKKLRYIKFMSSLSEDHLLVMSSYLDKVLPDECRNHSSDKCAPSSNFACYNVADGTLSCLDHHLPSDLDPDDKLSLHFFLHPSLAFPELNSDW